MQRVRPEPSNFASFTTSAAKPAIGQLREDGQMGLPGLRFDRLVPGQQVHPVAGLRDAAGVAGHAVLAGPQPVERLVRLVAVVDGTPHTKPSTPDSVDRNGADSGLSRRSSAPMPSTTKTT